MPDPLHVRARKRAGATVVDGFFKGVSRLGARLPMARPQRHGVKVMRDVPYLQGGLRAHLLDVYRPMEPVAELVDDQGRLPVILYVHGGGFRMLDKDSHWLPGLVFARRGYLVFNISYRLAPEHPFPAAIEDVVAAWDWVLKNAQRFGGDPERIAVAGESAGANLVAALTVATTFELDHPVARRAFEAGVVPRAALPAMGMLQVSDTARFQRRKKLSPWLVDRIVEVEEAYLPQGAHDLADPLVLLESDRSPTRALPPFHAAVGTADPLLDDTRRLEVALKARGVPHQVSYWPGGVHAFHMFVFRREARACWREILSFTEANLR